MPMTEAQMEAWLMAKTAGRNRTSLPLPAVPGARPPLPEQPTETLGPNDILISSERLGGGRRTRAYDIPTLAAKLVAQVPGLDQGMSDVAKRDAIKAATPNPYLVALLDEIIP